MKRLAPALVALALIAAACGGDAADGVASLTEDATLPPDSAAASTGDDAVVDDEAAMLAFAACVRDEGIDIEDPTVNADGSIDFGRIRGQVDPDEFDEGQLRAALDSCREHLEGVTLGRFGDGIDRTEIEDTLVEYAACMRDNGYDMPDPDFSGAGPGGEPGGGPFGSVDFNDPDFVTAQAACDDILGDFGRGPGTRGG